MYGNNFNNPYSNINGQLTQIQQQQQQQYLLNEFLKTEEGLKAHEVFVEAQTKWWNKVNGIAPKEDNGSEKINELESKLDNMSDMMANLMKELGGNKNAKRNN